jgi:uncharacterized protein (TIGR02266 family)
MRLLTLAFPSAQDFLAAYDDATRTLLATTKTEATAGENLVVEIAFPRLPNRPLVRAAVVEVVPGGLRLRFDHADTSTREFLVRMARGEVLDGATHRGHKRLPSALPARYAVDGVTAESTALDLSAGGCFVRATAPPPVGASITVDITAPDEDTPLRLTGVVAWIRGGDDAGFGIDFETPETPDGRRLRTMLRRAIGTGEVDLDKPTA